MEGDISGDMYHWIMSFNKRISSKTSSNRDQIKIAWNKTK